MNFDLRTGHLGDVLLAMPAMRAGDNVYVSNERYRVPGLSVTWNPVSGKHPKIVKSVHSTLAWLEFTNRPPIRHTLLGDDSKELLVLAPCVKAKAKQWHMWDHLMHRLPGHVLLTDDVDREEWMRTLNRAHTVVCPDTGTAHMADALGVPKVIALHGMGQKHFDRYSPYWDSTFCIVKDDMNLITVDDIMEKING